MNQRTQFQNPIPSNREEQLNINMKWLLEQLDLIHEALCPDAPLTTWQGRVEQTVKAAQHKAGK